MLLRFLDKLRKTRRKIFHKRASRSQSLPYVLDTANFQASQHLQQPTQAHPASQVTQSSPLVINTHQVSTDILHQQGTSSPAPTPTTSTSTTQVASTSLSPPTNVHSLSQLGQCSTNISSGSTNSSSGANVASLSSYLVSTTSTAPTSCSAPSVSPNRKLYKIGGVWVDWNPLADPSQRRIFDTEIKGILDEDFRRHINDPVYDLELRIAGLQQDNMRSAIVISCPHPQTKATIEARLRSREVKEWLKLILKRATLDFYVLLCDLGQSSGLDAGAEDMFCHRQSSLVLPYSASSLCGQLIRGHNGDMPFCCNAGGAVFDGKQYWLLGSRHPFEQISASCRSQSSTAVLSEDKLKESSKPFILLHDEDSHVEDDEVDLVGHEFQYEYRSLSKSTTPKDLKYEEIPVVSVSIDVRYPRQDHTALNKNQGLYSDWSIASLSSLSKTHFATIATRNEVDGILITEVGQAPGYSLPVLVATNGRTHEGFLRPGSVLLRAGNAAYDLQLVTLEQPLCRGCSGAWVVCGSVLYGYVVAIREDVPWAYMISITKVFADIEETFGLKVRLPSSTDQDGTADALKDLAAPCEVQSGLRPEMKLDLAHTPPLSTIEDATLQSACKSRTPMDTGDMLFSDGDAFERTSETFTSNKHQPGWSRRLMSNAQAAVSLLAERRKKSRRRKTSHKNSPSTVPSVASCSSTGGTDLELNGLEICTPPHELDIDVEREKTPVLRGRPAPVTTSRTSDLHSTRNMIDPVVRDALVSCKLTVDVDGNSYRYLESLHIRWRNKAEYKNLSQAAHRFVGERLGLKAKTVQNNFRKTVRYRMLNSINNDEISKSLVIDDQETWANALIPTIERATRYVSLAKTVLEVCWVFRTLAISRRPRCAYAEIVRSVVHGKMHVNWQKQKFLAKTDLATIFTYDTVQRLIAEDKTLHFHTVNGPGSRASFQETVMTSAIRLLATCIYVEAPLELLMMLVGLGKTDHCIPLPESARPTDIAPWVFDRFILCQNAFAPHTFDGGVSVPHHSDISEDVVVPILGEEVRDAIGRGGFGEVFKVRIDSAHHHFTHSWCEKHNGASCREPSTQRSPQYFALKRFIPHGVRTASDFRKEVDTLRTLSRVPHPNIVMLLASWTQGDRFYMLFPLAEQNLHSVLRCTEAPACTANFMVDLLGQLKGLADALQHIHALESDDPDSGPRMSYLSSARNMPHERLSCCHYDLKPENILVFPTEQEQGHKSGSIGEWKISDFGLAKISHVNPSSGTQWNSYQTQNLNAGDPVYGAPDYALQGSTSRPYDIWSFGCIVLEVLIYAMQSRGQNLNTFELARVCDSEDSDQCSSKFWSRTLSGDIRLKPSVISKLLEIANLCSDSPTLRDLVELTTMMLAIEPGERPHAGTVLHTLSVLHKLSAYEDSYSKTINLNKKIDVEELCMTSSLEVSHIREESSESATSTGSSKPQVAGRGPDECSSEGSLPRDHLPVTNLVRAETLPAAQDEYAHSIKAWVRSQQDDTYSETRETSGSDSRRSFSRTPSTIATQPTDYSSIGGFPDTKKGGQLVLSRLYSGVEHKRLHTALKEAGQQTTPRRTMSL